MRYPHILTTAAMATLVVVGAGCSSVTRGTPVSPVHINPNVDRTDYEVLATTEGKSTRVAILCGLVNILAGDKVSIPGLKLFEVQYAFLTPSPWTRILPVNVENRAYYKALAATPDADAVAGKAERVTDSGVPLIWTKKEVTYQGKAIKYKSHK